MSPSKVQARKLVLVSAFLLAGIAVYRDRQAGDSQGTYRALWGVGVLSLALSVLADFAPQVAGPFAALTVLGSMTSGGSSIIDRMLGTVAKAPAAAPAGTVARTPVPSPTTIRGGN